MKHESKLLELHDHVVLLVFTATLKMKKSPTSLFSIYSIVDSSFLFFVSHRVYSKNIFFNIF